MRDYSVISGETIVVRRTNPKTIPFIYLGVVFLVAFPIMFFLVPGMNQLPWFFLVLMLLVTFLNMRIWGLLTTITIGPEGVIYKSPIKEYIYPWKEIRAAGMILKGKQFVVLQPHEYNAKSYWRLKYVWLSIKPHEVPARLTFPDVGYCDFEYQKEAWELFNKYLIGKPDPNKIAGFNQYVQPQQPLNRWMH